MTATSDVSTSTAPASRKVCLTGERSGLRVPMRQVVLTTGDSVVLYDKAPDVRRGRIYLPVAE